MGKLITVETIISVSSLVISAISLWKTKKFSQEVHIFERKTGIYSELAYYLEKIYNNHELLITYYEEIRGIFAKSYFFASDEVYDLLSDFMKKMEKRIEYIIYCKVNHIDRDTSYSEFDLSRDILVEAMKKEIKFKKITRKDINEFEEAYSQYLGKQCISKEATNETPI